MKEIWKISNLDELITGVDEIDNAHKAICEKANELYDMCTNLKTKKEDLTNFINETTDIICKHFQDEIKLFKSYEIENCETHEKLHQEILDSITDIDIHPMPIITKAMMLNQVILFYLKEHLEKVDREYIKKLKEKQNEN